MTETAQTLKVPQDRETRVCVVPGEAVPYRFAYARAADTCAADDVGQDYVTIREDAHTFIFVLCDGVSQSFYGDLAARYLGDALLAWLSGCLPAKMDAKPIRTALAAHLHELTESATDHVQRQSLPPDLPPMLREVLQEKRALGSESTFVCGRIDLPGGDFPAGRVVLAWMGDSRLRLWTGDDAHTTDVGGMFETAQRWSTRRGPVGGGVNIFVVPLEQDGRRINRLMAYSDGLAALDDWSRDPSNHAVQDLITRAGEAATSDDISFLEVWLGPVPTHIEVGPLAAPYLLDVGFRERLVRAAWRPVSGASRYQIEVRDGEVRNWWASGTDWESPDMPTGEYRLRVRAWRDEGPGEWSEAHGVVVPELAVSGVSPVESGEPELAVAAPPSRRVSRRLGCAVAMLAVVVFTGGLVGLTLPVNGLLHEIIFGPTPTGTPTATPTAVFSAVPTATQVSPVTTPLFRSALPTPTGAPMAPPTHTPMPAWTPTVRPTLTPTVEDALAPSTIPAEPAPAEVSTP